MAVKIRVFRSFFWIKLADFSIRITTVSYSF